MASQLMTVRNAKKRGYQVDQMNARRQMLPQMMANKQRKTDIARQQTQFDQNYNLQRKGQKLQNRQAKIGMGIEGLKLGTNLMQNYGGKTLGGESGIFKGFGGKGSGINIGSGAAGLVGGFGASQLLKGKGKFKKAAVGAGAGALMGFLGGGGSGAFSGGVGGLIGGGLGSLF